MMGVRPEHSPITAARALVWVGSARRTRFLNIRGEFPKLRLADRVVSTTSLCVLLYGWPRPGRRAARISCAQAPDL